MNALTSTFYIGSPLSARLSRLAHLGPAELAAIKAAEGNTRRWAARREVMGEGKPIREGRAILSGWACRQRILADGRRQILSFLLPGDLMGLCRQSNPVASTTILAVTELVTCSVPTAGPEPSGLSKAYAHSAALEEHYHLSHITRLGQLSAPERVADWLLETQDRLALAGLASGDQLPLPLTQEFLADTLGLTSVHINRTLQSMRRDGLVATHGRMITLLDRERLSHMVHYSTPRVTLDGWADSASSR